MIDDSLLPFSLPSVGRKKITAAFDGGRISSDGGVLLLALAERCMGIADRLAAEITDRRDPTRVVHALSDILRARILAIACGYEDANDLDHLRSDPALKPACGHLPDSSRDLCLSIGTQKGPRIGIQKGPRWERLVPVVHRRDPRAAECPIRG
jgi:hypothetical protein